MPPSDSPPNPTAKAPWSLSFRLACLALVIAFLGAMGMWYGKVATRNSQDRIARLKALRPSAGPVAKTSANAGSAAPEEPIESTPPAGRPFRESPLLAQLVANPPDAALEAEIKELWLTIEQLTKGLNKETGKIDFREWAKAMGLPGADEMMSEEAARHFLAMLEKSKPLLAKWEEMAKGAPWHLEPEEWITYQSKEFSLRNSIGRALAAATQAAWTVGDGAQGENYFQSLALTNNGLYTRMSLIEGLVTMSIGTAWTLQTLALGLAEHRFSPDQLTDAKATLHKNDALSNYASMLQAERSFLDIVLSDSAIRNDILSPQSSPMDRILSVFTSPTMVEANRDLLQSKIDFDLTRFDQKQRLYTPPTAEETAQWDEMQANPSLLERFYYRYALTGNVSMDRIADQILTYQSNLDQAAIAIALEQHFQSTGAYPSKLSEIEPAFPNGVPHDVATGQPYQFELTPNDSTATSATNASNASSATNGPFRLWGSGADQKDNGGDPTQDTVWGRRSAKPR